MAAGKIHESSQALAPVMGEFYPLQTLWVSSLAGKQFASEGSARWFIRKHRDSLVRARAVAIDCGRWVIHPARFRGVLEESSFELAAAKVSRMSPQ